MVKSKGYRARTRKLFKKNPRERGKINISRVLQEYHPGNLVLVKIDSSIQKGMPHKRYHGKVGVITGKRGRGYTLTVSQGDSIKKLIVRSEHLTPCRSG